ncbi:MAG: hypothetical protein AAB547_01175 [Patescibacteria group bacterium]
MKLYLSLLEVSAFLAERFSAGALAQIFPLDVVTRIALRIVVVHRPQNGVPCCSYHTLSVEFYMWITQDRGSSTVTSCFDKISIAD